jgi:cobalt transporter subunit CbtA
MTTLSMLRARLDAEALSIAAARPRARASVFVAGFANATVCMTPPTTSATPSPSPATDRFMTTRILSGALIAGLAAGFLAALLTLWTLTPLIVEAETYEHGVAHAHADGSEHVHASPEDAGASLPSRALGTVAMTLVAYAGFGLALGAGMAFAARNGQAPHARAGLLWGLAGFAAVQLAPAVGLPPELPGAVTAELAARRAWWALCAAGHGGGTGDPGLRTRSALACAGPRADPAPPCPGSAAAAVPRRSRPPGPRRGLRHALARCGSLVLGGAGLPGGALAQAPSRRRIPA